MQPQPSDEILLAQRITQGDLRALEDLFQCFADPLFAFIFHHMHGERADAEEIWQDTLVAALHALPGYRGESRLFTWLCAIARHKIADHYRKQGSAARQAQKASEISAAMLAQDLLPEEALLSGTVRSRVIETLYSLPEDYRQALTARYMEERPVAEVAHLLGKSYKAAESLLVRARQAFQVAFGSS
jgi:RNA polymerase sigma-70 factor, ECF subfamily